LVSSRSANSRRFTFDELTACEGRHSCEQPQTSGLADGIRDRAVDLVRLRGQGAGHPHPGTGHNRRASRIAE
jgi:hypothetical protein